MEHRVPEVNLGLAGETWPMTSYIQTNIPSMIDLARGIKGSNPMEIAQSVIDFIAEKIEYPVNYRGQAATSRSAYVFKIAGPFYHYKHEARYGWLLPNQSLCVRRGICYDTSVLATSLLRIRGIEAYTALGVLQRKGKIIAKHAWCVATIDGEQYLLETTVPGGTEPVLLAEAYHGLGKVTYIEFIGFDESRYWEKTEELARYWEEIKGLRILRAAHRAQSRIRQATNSYTRLRKEADEA